MNDSDKSSRLIRHEDHGIGTRKPLYDSPSYVTPLLIILIVIDIASDRVYTLHLIRKHEAQISLHKVRSDDLPGPDPERWWR